MTFRSDNEALLQRLAALEQQALRADELERRVGELELENQELRRRAAVPVASPAPNPSDVSSVASIYFDAKLDAYVAALIDASRTLDARVLSGARPGDAIRIADAAKTHALQMQRPYATPEDVKLAARAVFAERIILRAAAAHDPATTDAIIRRLLDEVEVP